MNGPDDVFDPEPERANTRDEWLGLKQADHESQEFDRQELERLRAVVAAIGAIEPTWHRGMYGCPDDMLSMTALRVALETEATA